MKVPRTTCAAVWRTKLFSTRGPKCWDATVSATIVTEKVTLIAVIIAPMTAERSARAPSAELGRSRASVPFWSSEMRESRNRRSTAAPNPASVTTSGTNQ